MATFGASTSWCAAAAAGRGPDPHGAGDSSSTLQPGVHPWRTRPLYDAAEDAWLWLWLRDGWKVADTCSLRVGAAAEVAATTVAAATAAAAAEEHEQLQLFCPGRSQEPAEGEGSWATRSGEVSG